jgi:hypothetical protein
MNPKGPAVLHSIVFVAYSYRVLRSGSEGDTDHLLHADVFQELPLAIRLRQAVGSIHEPEVVNPFAEDFERNVPIPACRRIEQ